MISFILGVLTGIVLCVLFPAVGIWGAARIQQVKDWAGKGDTPK